MSAPPPVTELIPHRAPFLLIDEVLELEPDRALAVRTLTEDDAFFGGHYPDRPMMPGVLMCEAALQTGAYLMAARMRQAGEVAHGVPVVTRLESVKFKRGLAPGDRFEIEVERTEAVGPAQWMSARLRKDGKLVAQLRFAVMLAPEESE